MIFYHQPVQLPHLGGVVAVVIVEGVGVQMGHEGDVAVREGIDREGVALFHAGHLLFVGFDTPAYAEEPGFDKGSCGQKFHPRAFPEC